MAHAKRNNGKNNQKILTYDRGKHAEMLAAFYLRLKGYKILKTRYKTSQGEIDIIAVRDEILCFIEVKARRSQEEALESLTYNMRRRIERCATRFIAENAVLQHCTLRFDLVTVAPFSFAKPFFIQHLDNAWLLDA